MDFQLFSGKQLKVYNKLHKEEYNRSATESVHLGTIPAGLLDMNIERVRTLKATDVTLVIYSC